ncbi:MAG: hypothetical protein ACQEXJ_02220 [Myxococcota bacterium]
MERIGSLIRLVPVGRLVIVSAFLHEYIHALMETLFYFLDPTPIALGPERSHQADPLARCVCKPPHCRLRGYLSAYFCFFVLVSPRLIVVGV